MAAAKQRHTTEWWTSCKSGTRLSVQTQSILGIIRGTTADNITMEKEALTLEALAIAITVRNSGGIVIVQVKHIAERHTLNPRQVKIPAF
jgi:acyl CoA:acetate/3-ketoacid CoA transferase